MRYGFHTADVFTTHIFGGNPLAVFPDARGLDTARMQRIAGELNLSETVFVFPPEDERHTRRLRIFTPRTELPFAGHPTVGCAHVLVRTGAVRPAGEPADLVFEEGVGPVRVSVSGGGPEGSAHLWAPRPLEHGPEPPAPETLAEVLSLEPAEILDTRRDHPRAISGGVPGRHRGMARGAGGGDGAPEPARAGDRSARRRPRGHPRRRNVRSGCRGHDGGARFMTRAHRPGAEPSTRERGDLIPSHGHGPSHALHS